MTAKVELLTPSGGKVILDPTNTAVDRVLTLPAVAGTVLNTASDIEAQVKTATSATGAAPIFSCRAWVNFDGGTGSIRSSGNVSSVTKNGTGDYTVNFTTAMPDADYAVAGFAGNATSTSTSTFSVRSFNPNGDLTENSCRVAAVVTGATTTNLSDLTHICVAFFR